jgi:hypothetical protein
MAYRAMSGRTAPDESPRAALAGDADLEKGAWRPWPYSTGDGRLVGSFLAGLGFALQTCRARRGHRTLELGATTGHLSFALARTGCAVTVRADDPADGEAMRRRAAQTGAPVVVLKATDSAGSARFDFVCSHGGLGRRLDHPSLIAAVRDDLLAPGGRVVLVGEPLNEELPEPWMLDPSLTAEAARAGSIALSFRPSYLLGLLADLGFNATFFPCPHSPYGDTIVAWKRPRQGRDLEKSTGSDELPTVPSAECC